VEFIKKHPSSRLVRDAYLEMTKGIFFSDEDGDAIYGRIFDLFPHDPEIANQLAEARQYIRTDRPDINLDRYLTLSENALREAETVSLPRTAQNLAKLQILKGNLDNAEETYGRDFLADQVKTWTETLIGYAEFWLNRKRNTEDAGAALRLALSLSPVDPSLRRRAAFLYFSPLAKIEKALDIYGPEFLKTIQASPKDLYSYFSFWIGLKSNEASAFEALEALLKLKPDSVYYRDNAASVLLKADYRDRALAVFGPEFIAGRQDDMMALYEYGMFWLQKNSNLDQAMPALLKSLRTIPKSFMTQNQVAKLLLKANRPEDVAAIYGSAYLAGIRDDASALCTYAQFWLMEAKTNKDSALEALETAARITPLSMWDRMRIARLLFDAGKPDRAEAVYGIEYLKTVASDAEALIRYASFWKSINRNLFSALDAARRASQAAPDNANAWGILAELYVANGDLKEALPAIEKACRLTKTKKALEKFEALSKQIKAELEKIKK
jgi:tetratricopeptide (TPR) repeat protein